MMAMPRESRLFSSDTWRRWWNALCAIEAAASTTEADILDKRLSRLEAEVEALRLDFGKTSVGAPERGH